MKKLTLLVMGATIGASLIVLRVSHAEPQNSILPVGITGLGRVVSDPSGIDCPGDYVEEYSSLTSIKLIAKPGKGQKALTFTGACHPIAKKRCNAHLDKPTRLIQVVFTKSL